ncbi:MAG: serine O-acetyltransferase EpsC [Rubinisphaera brasiliensis]|uniref:Serine O-acetyltransferase n=1 Tax=Rubinisphaera brasiliensis (strain ATCC 49424 / DSM 5305 / JCM 21570 / IAM 15109 / NBRC 103401 / IFAM 1448) TaxID=756272 RepID=F0SMT3_RUBBR|nr:serine O-acetyltransferase EpsC [Rubinisphaera brasiliensis]ADY58902.1 serine O-acetyltransferase [Rubinisphaera brasiliensis DSM 5305]
MASDFRRKDILPDITDQIVASYHEIGSINHLGHCPLPNYTEVVDLIDDLVEILYPGYRRRQNLHFGNVMYHVGDLLDSLHDRLTTQICRALRHEFTTRTDTQCESLVAHDFEAEAQDITIEFLKSLPSIRNILAKDVQAAFDGDPAAGNLDEIIFSYPGLQAITVHRLAHELYRRSVPFIPRMMAERSHSLTGIDIHPGATIGHSFFIDHGTGVVIGETCEIHPHVKIYQGVTLGALSFPKDGEGKLIRGQKRHPTIGEGVVIYANATILGGDTVIGANSVVGASVSINKSIPPATIVTIEKPSLRFREAS